MVVLISATIGLIALLFISVRGLNSYIGPIFAVGFVSLVLSVIIAVGLAFGTWFWVSSEHKARLINNQLGTHYTAEDVFYGSNYIDEVRELHRQRIEVNGNLLRDGK